MVHYQKPDWLTKHVFNPLVHNPKRARATRLDQADSFDIGGCEPGQRV
jgi:hypothetical protein